jgi:hypothetical protein
VNGPGRKKNRAREVVHTVDGSWMVGDGNNDPNLAGASVATRIARVVGQKSSIAALASTPPLANHSRCVGRRTESDRRLHTLSSVSTRIFIPRT